MDTIAQSDAEVGMSAGASARYEEQRSLLLSEQYEQLSTQSREQARRYRVAAESEESVAATLHALSELGWQVLADRRWGRRSNVDFLLVGPGGVVIADVKSWRDLQVRGESIFRDDENVDDELEKNLALRGQVIDALADLGLVPSAIQVALVFHRRSVRECVRGVHLVGESAVATWLTRLPRRLDPAAVRDVAAALSDAFPVIVPATPRAVGVRRHVAMPRPTIPADPVLFDVDELTDALVTAALAAPIEEWMTFLHPAQRRLVSLRHRGPARVRGSAGTGKTVVGLHRAAHLARASREPIHFVTYVRTLPVVLRSLATRLDPEAAERIEFSGLHQLAMRVLADAGVEVRLDSSRARTAFAQAWAKAGRDSVLADLDQRHTYWQEEIDYVIKGRGIDDFEEYAAVARTGRRTPMTRMHREAMWDLYVEYAANLGRVRCEDFNDVLILARDLLRSGAHQVPCGGVIVDEVQDLTMVGVQFLHALAGDGEDRFLVIGDGQQSIYPGGFSLADAGVDVRGRATVLEVNYRNTVEILEAAVRVVGADSFDDLDGVDEAGQRRVEVRRHGREPVVVHAASAVELDRALLARLRVLVDDGVRVGDVAVLCQRTRDVAHAVGVVRAAGFDVVDLLDYAGLSDDRIKVGTVKRAKGLEFAHVLLPDLSVALDPPWKGEGSDAYEERLARQRREVFVAMTRARDGLWLGYRRP